MAPEYKDVHPQWRVDFVSEDDKGVVRILERQKTEWYQTTRQLEELTGCVVIEYSFMQEIRHARRKMRYRPREAQQ